jgi:hypothetical protein
MKADPPKAEGAATLSDEIAVFQAYMGLINSERETLWARHNALLVANSLIIGALALSPAALWQNKGAALAMIGSGLLITAAWAVISVEGWRSIRRHMEIAGTFGASCFARLPNPFAEALCNRAQAAIHRTMLLVVGVFMLMYLGLGYIRLSLT